MNPMIFLISTLILGSFTALLMWLMWRSWSRRGRRDAALAPSGVHLTGDALAAFDRVFYVATTPENEPLERVALPGLKFRGWATLRVLTDGIEVTVTGEPTVSLPRDTVLRSSHAQLTIDKVVEHDGLAVLVWNSERGSLASSFRFGTPHEHQTFAQSVEEMLRPEPHSSPEFSTKEA